MYADFLKRHGMFADLYDYELEKEKMLCDMESGLSGDRSSLMMLVTYISAKKAVPFNETITVLDAGGTNLRRAAVTFRENGKTEIDGFKKVPLPGSIEAIDADGFFGAVADFVLPIAKENDRLGFCFSYVTEPLPNRDGRLVAFCKEVNVKGAEKAEICSELKKALKKRGYDRDIKCVLINDSVATLLGGKASGEDPDVGFILGTGLNACYVEKTKNTKAAFEPGYTDDDVIINTELGTYRGFPRGDIDEELDAASLMPGDHMAEKMMSGQYIGELMIRLLKKAAEEGLMSAPGFESVPPGDGETFISGKTGSVFDSLDDADKSCAAALVTEVYRRAAKLQAIVFGALRQHIAKDGEITVCANGTTFERSYTMRRFLDEYIDKYDGGKVRFIAAENDTLMGTAVAGLTN